jgi:hypothetical protein
MAYTTTDAALKSNQPERMLGAMIDNDRACPKCGFNVVGRQIGEKCPECGRQIFFGLPVQEQSQLAEAPFWYIRITQAALWLVLIAVVGACAVTPVSSMFGASVVFIYGGVSLVWLAGLVLLAVPRPRDRDEGLPMRQINSTLKEAAVFSQAMWPIAAGILAFGTTASWVGAVTIALLIFAGLGVIVTMNYLAEVARFVGDEDRGRRLTTMSVVLLVTVGLWLGGIRLNVSMIVGNISLLAPIIILATGFFLWDLFQLAMAGSWASNIAKGNDARDARLREKFELDRAEALAAEDNVPFGGPVQAPIGSMMGLKPTKRK